MGRVDMGKFIRLQAGKNVKTAFLLSAKTAIVKI